MLTRMPFSTRALCCIGIACVSDIARAQTLDTDTLVGTYRPPKWEAGVAGALVTVPDYPGSDENQTSGLPAPYFVYHGKAVESDEGGSRLRQVLSPGVELSVSGGGALASDSAKSDARRGMPDLGYLLEAGPNIRLIYEGFDPNAKILIDLPVRAITSINRHLDLGWEGFVFAPELAYQSHRFMAGRMAFRTSLGAQYATTLLQRYYYTVEPQYATSDRPTYNAKSGYLGASLSTRLSYEVTRKVSTFVSLEYDNYAGAENRDSPVFRSNFGYAAVFGFSWSFLQSHQSADE